MTVGPQAWCTRPPTSHPYRRAPTSQTAHDDASVLRQCHVCCGCLGRDARTSTQVWSTSSGYPGHVVYREFHRQEAHSGLRYWRITDAGAELRGRDWYDPTRARQQVLVEAEHFVGLVEELVTSFAARHSGRNRRRRGRHRIVRPLVVRGGGMVKRGPAPARTQLSRRSDDRRCLPPTLIAR